MIGVLGGIIVYGDNNQVIGNTIDTYDEGIEIWMNNNKVVGNEFIDCVGNILDEGLEIKIHASIE